MKTVGNDTFKSVEIFGYTNKAFHVNMYHRNTEYFLPFFSSVGERESFPGNKSSYFSSETVSILDLRTTIFCSRI